MIHTSDAILKLLNAVQHGHPTLAFEDIVDIVVEAGEELIGDYINRDAFKNYILDSTKIFINIRKSFYPHSSTNMKRAVDDLLKVYNVESIDNGNLLKNCFYELSEYDKLIDVDGRVTPVILNEVFEIISLYKMLISSHIAYSKSKDSIDRTIALSTSHTPKNMLLPLKPYIRINLHNGETRPKVYSNIVESYIKDPYGTDFVLSIVRSLGLSNLMNIDSDKLLALEFASQFANSSTPVHKKDIVTSLKIVISALYLNNNIFQTLLRLDKHIPHERLAANIDLILSYFFDIDTTKKRTSHRKFKDSIQIRTHFNMIPLYEYVRKGKEKVNPVLEDKDLMRLFQEKIKVKISKI